MGGARRIFFGTRASALGLSVSEVWAMREGILISMLGAITLTLSACASTGAICERSGGTYSGGTCTRWSPGQEAAQKWCETHGHLSHGPERLCLWRGSMTRRRLSSTVLA